MIISAVKAGLSDSKFIAWTIFVGGMSSTNRAVYLSSFSPGCVVGWRVEQEHAITAAHLKVEMMNLAGHFARCKPGR